MGAISLYVSGCTNQKGEETEYKGPVEGYRKKETSNLMISGLSPSTAIDNSKKNSKKKKKIAKGKLEKKQKQNWSSALK